MESMLDTSLEQREVEHSDVHLIPDDESCDSRSAQTLTRPLLTIKEAAEACGVSDKTIRRNLDRFPNAHRLDAPNGPQKGPWVIPATDLIAAGYTVGKPSPPIDDATPSPRAGTKTDELQKRIQEMETAAQEQKLRETELRHRAELSEAVAHERARALEDARLSMRMLETETASTRARSDAKGFQERLAELETRLAEQDKQLGLRPVHGLKRRYRRYAK